MASREEKRCKAHHNLETTLHIVARCPFTTKIWQTYEPIYTIPFVYEHVILTINLANTSTPKAIVKLLLTITNYILTKLWSARNKLKYDRVLPNYERSLKTINAHITYLLSTHHIHHSRNNTPTIFQEQFLINNTFGNLKNERLNITY